MTWVRARLLLVAASCALFVTLLWGDSGGFLTRSAAAAQCSPMLPDPKAYLKKTLAEVSDIAIQKILAASYLGIPYENLISTLVTAEHVSVCLQEKNYLKAFEIAAADRTKSALAAVLFNTGLPTVSTVASLAAAPIVIAVQSAGSQVVQGTLDFNMKAYAQARDAGISHSQIIAGQDNMNVGLMFENGWLWPIEAKTWGGARAKPVPLPGIQPRDVYDLARLAYEGRASFDAEKTKILAGATREASTIPAGRLEIPPTPARRVNDYASLLTPSDHQRLEELITQGELQTKAQMVVAIFRSLQGEKLEDYTLLVANKWGIGRAGINDGVVLFIFRDERQARLAVGKGFERVITNAGAATILKDTVAPLMRAGRHSQAIEGAIHSVYSRAAAQTMQAAAETPARSETSRPGSGASPNDADLRKAIEPKMAEYGPVIEIHKLNGQPGEHMGMKLYGVYLWAATSLDPGWYWIKDNSKSGKRLLYSPSKPPAPALIIQTLSANTTLVMTWDIMFRLSENGWLEDSGTWVSLRTCLQPAAECFQEIPRVEHSGHPRIGPPQFAIQQPAAKGPSVGAESAAYIAEQECDSMHAKAQEALSTAVRRGANVDLVDYTMWREYNYLALQMQGKRVSSLFGDPDKCVSWAHGILEKYKASLGRSAVPPVPPPGRSTPVPSSPPNPDQTVALPPASSSRAGQSTQVRFVNETGGPVRLQVTGNSKLQVGGKAWVTIPPGKSDEFPVTIGEQKLRVEQIKLMGFLIVGKGARFEKTIGIGADTIVRITDKDFE